MKRILITILLSAVWFVTTAQTTTTLPAGYTPWATQLYKNSLDSILGGKSGINFIKIARSADINRLQDSITNKYSKSVADAKFVNLTTDQTAAGNKTWTGNQSVSGTGFYGSLLSLWGGARISNGTPFYIQNSLGNSDVTIFNSGGTGASILNINAPITTTGTVTAPTLVGALTGNASTATTLQTARLINGVSFNGSADITVTAAAGTLTGTALATNVVASSLTSVGTLTNLTVTNPITGSITGNSATVTTNANLTGVVTSVGNATSIADAALSIAKTSGLQSAIDLKAPLASPALTGTPTAPTATAGTNTTQIATTAFVAAADAGNVKLTGNQTVAGTKTFTGPIIAAGVGNIQIIDSGSGLYTGFTPATLTQTRALILPDASGTVALTSDLAGYVTISGVQTITGAKTFNNLLTISANALSSSTNGLYQAVSDDYFKQYAYATIADRGEYVFETGDNGFPWASNGQRWRYSYTAGISGVAKDVFLIDYDAITTPNAFTAGNAKIYNFTSDAGFVRFGHKDMLEGGNFGFAQYSDGSTYIKGNLAVQSPMTGTSATFTRNLASDYIGNFFNTNTTAGTSFGMFIKAGTNSSDLALNINNAANTVSLFQVKGDGSAVHTGDNTILTLASATGTSQAAMVMSSTVGNARIGLDNSAGSVAGGAAYALNLLTTGNYPVQTSVNGAIRQTISSTAATYTVPLTGTSATFSENVFVNKAGSNTVGAGPFVQLGSTASGRYWLDQMNASFGLDKWHYTGAIWTKYHTIDASGNNTWTGNGAFSGTISASNLTSGTYTPTVAAGGGVTTGATANGAWYSRVGNRVDVSGSFASTVSGSGTDYVTISLPIAKTFTNSTFEASGSTAQASAVSGVIYSTPLGTTVTYQSPVTGAGTSTRWYSFSYYL